MRTREKTISANIIIFGIKVLVLKVILIYRKSNYEVIKVWIGLDLSLSDDNTAVAMVT